MTELAPIGHNSPPDPIDTITAAFEDARAEAESWLDGKAVETEGQMKAVDELRGSMRQWRLGLERGQKDASAPMHDAWKRELERWKPTIADAKMIEDGLVAIVDGFKRKLAAEKEAARKKAEAEAWEATRKAQEAARLADVANIDAQREAAAAMAEAEEKQRQAQIAAKDTVKGLRTVYRYAIDDHRAALHWIAKNDRDAMTFFVEAYVAKNFRTATIDGVTVTQGKEAF